MRRVRIALAVAGASILAMTASAQTLRIGHDAPFEPFGMVEAGRSTGMLVEIVAEALKRAKLDFALVPLKLDESETALVEGKIDALAFKGDTAERRAKLDFTKPLVVSGGALFTRAGTSTSANLKDFAGKIVVTPRRGPLFAQIAKAAPDVKLIESTSYEESLQFVLDRKADAAALNWQAGIRMARANHVGKFTLPAAPYVSVPLSFAVAKGKNADVLAKVEATVEAMRADGSFKAFEEKWLGR